VVGTELFAVIATLFSQPSMYWKHLETAGGGNSLAHFVMAQGLIIFLLYGALSLFACFLFVSVVPKKVALVGMLSLVLLRYFEASDRLLYYWNLGLGPLIYGLMLGAAVGLLVFPTPDKIGADRESTDFEFNANMIVRRLRWVMVGAMIFDSANTLLGQPSSYWEHPETANEGFQLARFFIVRGPSAYLFYDMVIFSGYLFFVSNIPAKAGLLAVSAITISSYFGGCTWLYYHWHLGAKGPVIYGIILSVVYVLLAFPGEMHRQGRSERVMP
jgi:hypothetical protein